jgi:TonB family protein
MSAAYNVSYKIALKETSLTPVLVYSFVFHIFIFFVVPIATRILWRPKIFERPQTFQLVRVPPMAAPVRKVSEKQIVKKKTVTKRPVPKTIKDSRPVQKKEQTEDLSELEELLGGLPQPISAVSVAAGFKYDWYLRSIEDRVKRYWSPSINDPNLSVVLMFTIYRNGEISDIKITDGSGNAALDNLAKRAVKLSAPFGKLPTKWGNELSVEHKLIASRE